MTLAHYGDCGTLWWTVAHYGETVAHYGTDCGTLWWSCGTLLELWHTMVDCGTLWLWDAMAGCGTLRQAVERYGRLWHTMAGCGKLCQAVAHYGGLWHTMVIGTLWWTVAHYMVNCGTLWSCGTLW
ncbi:uncharacterized protein LOC121853993 [Homarus americanus]|uniref:uncharacterized protein LOC121853993 n=1 Tax=Homarus americanus TaxID=6706 RepID=UPI001C483ECC|nr:uncharacterized protein LOC121853993 [Homarus americanus]